MKKLYRRSISGLMALLICFTTILGGGITAFAASSSGEVAKSYSIGFPRSGDANLDYSGTWGHDELHYMNGWTSGEATWMTTLHTIGSFDGPACYCIEPGVPRLLEKTYTRYGEDYWKNYPSDYNSTIDADTIKTLLGRIMQYGYQGDLSLDWRSQNEADADKMAHMMATQVLVWETVVGERDANFNHVDPGNADAVKSMYRTSHPLYSRFSAYYDSIEASVQSHTVIPSFMSKTPNKAQTVELKWDGNQYTATLTDSNHVVSDYTFSSNLSDIVFTSNGDTLTITAKTAPAEPVTISASKNNIRKGVVVWSDGPYGPDGTMQDAVTYAATVMDPVQAFLNLKVSYGSAKIVKTSEDGKVDGRENKKSEMQGAYTTEFGFRADTEKYAFVLRCNPTRGDYNFYCLCYVKEWLDKHIEEANRDIRFIDSHYKELFRIPDGERIIVTDRDGKTESYPCRYIDSYHTEVGRNLFHICEFAERMEQGGCTYAPMEPPLPPMCYSILPSTGEVIQIDRWQKGYTATRFNDGNRAENEAIKDKFNEKLGVTKAQEQAMLAGSMIRWDSIAAKPKSYDENGKAIKPKDYER